jgi:hypothetical protein
MKFGTWNARVYITQRLEGVEVTDFGRKTSGRIIMETASGSGVMYITMNLHVLLPES